MNIGLIGCGGMGTTHCLSLKALSEHTDIQVTALADCRPEFLKKAAEHWPKAALYSTGMELIQSEKLDAVDICLPSYLHAEHMLLAMQRGFHVFAEKPVCLTRKDAQALLDANKKYPVKVMVGQVLRLFEEYRYLKDCYDNKTYGALKSITMNRISGNVNWSFEDWFHSEEKSGSVIMDLHIHDLDFLRYMLGEPKAIDVHATAFADKMANHVFTAYEYENCFAITQGLWDESEALPFEAGYHACFENASIVFNSNAKNSVTVYTKNGEIVYPSLQRDYTETNNSAGINVANLGPYYNELKYFIECVQKDMPIELASLPDAINSALLGMKEWELANEYIASKKEKI